MLIARGPLRVIRVVSAVSAACPLCPRNLPWQRTSRLRRRANTRHHALRWRHWRAMYDTDQRRHIPACRWRPFLARPGTLARHARSPADSWSTFDIRSGCSHRGCWLTFS